MKRFVSLSVLIAMLSACGGDDGSSTASADTPSQLASANGIQPLADKWAVIGSTTTTSTANNPSPFATFDFQNGTVYPQKAAVSVGSVSVPVGASEAFVPIRINRNTPNTVIVRVMTRNGSGTLAGLEGVNFTRTVTTVFFRPGDPLKQTVRIPLLKMDAGRTFDLILPEGVVGGGQINNAGHITAVVGAAPGVAKTSGFRPARTFAATGTMAYKLDPATVKWSDAGGTDTWTTKLPHGRSQPANGETGLYLDPVLYPTAPLPPFAVENGEVVIRSQQLISPIFYNNQYWYHGAAILTGQKMPATQIQYGQYEWDAMMPNRRGGWPRAVAAADHRLAAGDRSLRGLRLFDGLELHQEHQLEHPRRGQRDPDLHRADAGQRRQRLCAAGLRHRLSPLRRRHPARLHHLVRRREGDLPDGQPLQGHQLVPVDECRGQAERRLCRRDGRDAGAVLRGVEDPGLRHKRPAFHPRWRGAASGGGDPLPAAALPRPARLTTSGLSCVAIP